MRQNTELAHGTQSMSIEGTISNKNISYFQRSLWIGKEFIDWSNQDSVLWKASCKTNTYTKTCTILFQKLSVCKTFGYLLAFDVYCRQWEIIQAWWDIVLSRIHQANIPLSRGYRFYFDYGIISIPWNEAHF